MMGISFSAKLFMSMSMWDIQIEIMCILQSFCPSSAPTLKNLNNTLIPILIMCYCCMSLWFKCHITIIIMDCSFGEGPVEFCSPYKHYTGFPNFCSLFMCFSKWGFLHECKFVKSKDVSSSLTVVLNVIQLSTILWSSN